MSLHDSLGKFNNFVFDFIWGNHRCATALMHDPCDEAVFRHLGNANPATAICCPFDFLLWVKRSGVDDIRQVFVALDNNIADHLRVEDAFFVRGLDYFRTRLEVFAGRNDAFHP